MSKSDTTESWDDKTDPDSLAGMRKAIRENTRVCNSALEWSMKTYELVKPHNGRPGLLDLSKGIRRATAWAAAAVLISLLTFACEMFR